MFTKDLEEAHEAFSAVATRLSDCAATPPRNHDVNGLVCLGCILLCMCCSVLVGTLSTCPIPCLALMSDAMAPGGHDD